MSTVRLALVFTLLLLGACQCAERPAECTPALRERQKALDTHGLLALDARRAAAALVERALAAADAQDARFKGVRNYDEARRLCADAAAALDAADAAVKRAKVTAERVAARDAEAARALGTLDARLALARGLADSGVVDAAATAALRQVAQAGVDARRELDRARAEQKASGYVLELEAFHAAADRAVATIDEVRRTTLAISEQVASRCRLELSGEELAEAGLRAHADWVVLEVPGADARRYVVLRLDREKQTCAVAYDRKGSAAAIDSLDGDLITWNIPGTIPFKLLVGWGKSSAWFLEGGRFWKHAHERAAGFTKACAGRVTCERPRVGPRALQADCDCAAPEGSPLLPSDLRKTARYAWDGARVNAEP